MATRFFCDSQGNYLGGFDGVLPPAGAVEVPEAPPDARWHIRNFALDRWDEKPGRADAEASEGVDAGFANAKAKIAHLIFEIEFDQENRLRVIEGRPEITRAQYRSALIAAWKTLS